MLLEVGQYFAASSTGLDGGWSYDFIGRVTAIESNGLRRVELVWSTIGMILSEYDFEDVILVTDPAVIAAFDAARAAYLEYALHVKALMGDEVSTDPTP